jgi:hypothetical protein
MAPQSDELCGVAECYGRPLLTLEPGRQPVCLSQRAPACTCLQLM